MRRQPERWPGALAVSFSLPAAAARVCASAGLPLADCWPNSPDRHFGSAQGDARFIRITDAGGSQRDGTTSAAPHGASRAQRKPTSTSA
jgi:hypothetical protein